MPKLSKTSLATVISFPTKVRYYCMTPTSEGTCGYMWLVGGLPANGRSVSTTRACMRCGHVSTWNANNKATRPKRRSRPARLSRTEPLCTDKQRDYLMHLMVSRPGAEQALTELGLSWPPDVPSLTVGQASAAIKRLLDA